MWSYAHLARSMVTSEGRPHADCKILSKWKECEGHRQYGGRWNEMLQRGCQTERGTKAERSREAAGVERAGLLFPCQSVRTRHTWAPIHLLPREGGREREREREHRHTQWAGPMKRRRGRNSSVLQASSHLWNMLLLPVPLSLSLLATLSHSSSSFKLHGKFIRKCNTLKKGVFV